MKTLKDRRKDAFPTEKGCPDSIIILCISVSNPLQAHKMIDKILKKKVKGENSLNLYDKPFKTKYTQCAT